MGSVTLQAIGHQTTSDYFFNDEIHKRRCLEIHMLLMMKCGNLMLKVFFDFENIFL